MVYIVENNGVYGLTKGSFRHGGRGPGSLSTRGRNEFPPIDICRNHPGWLRLCSPLLLRDAQQVRELMKAAPSHAARLC